MNISLILCKVKFSLSNLRSRDLFLCNLRSRDPILVFFNMVRPQSKCHSLNGSWIATGTSSLMGQKIKATTVAWSKPVVLVFSRPWHTFLTRVHGTFLWLFTGLCVCSPASPEGSSFSPMLESLSDECEENWCQHGDKPEFTVIT